MRLSSFAASFAVSVVFVLAMNAHAGAQSMPTKQNVAVLGLRNTSGLSQGEAEVLSDRLRIELFNTGRVNVMEREQMQEILKEQGFQQSGTCSDEACLVEMGKLLGVQRVIMGTIGKVGSMFLLNARVIDVQSAKITGAVSRDVNGGIEQLVYELKNVAAELVRGDVRQATSLDRIRLESHNGQDESSSKSMENSTIADDESQQETGETSTAYSSSGCNSGMYMINDTCFSRSDVVSAGATGFYWSVFPYGVGALYSAVATIIWSSSGWDEFDWQPYYVETNYYSTETFLALCPQSSAIVIPGLFNQFAKVKQRKYISALGGQPSNGLYIAGWALYGASILTPTLCFINFGVSSHEGGIATAIINAPVQIASFIVNVAAYAKNRKALESLTGKNVSQGPAIEMSPYILYTRQGVGAGLSVGF